jgi:hypothetical protein
MNIAGRAFLGIVAMVVLWAGCASDVANRYYSANTYPPKDPAQVLILSSKPNRPFEVIADFQSRGESPEAVRKKAAAIGADAVIIAVFGGVYSRAEEWAGKDRHEGTYSRITGTAIVFTDK